MAIFLAGFAETVITPPPGVTMGGYGNRPGPAEGVHDELKAVAAVFDDRTHKCAICAADLVDVTPKLVAAVRARVAARVFIAATHTHSGPSLTSDNPINQAYALRLEDLLVHTIQMADLRRRDARIGAAAGEAHGIGGNRRSADGPVHPGVRVLRVDSVRTDAPMGLIVQHACHATTLDLHNLLLSADYPGYLRDYVHASADGQPTVLFLNGACGDINPGGYSAEDSALGKPIPDRTYERAEEIGAALGEEAVRVARDIETHGPVPVRGFRAPVELPTRPVGTPAEEDATAAAAQQALREIEAAGASEAEQDRARLELMYARSAARRARKYLSLPNGMLTTEIQGVGVGEALFLGIPGELFVEVGLELEQASPFDHTFVVGYANGSAGYFPAPSAMDQGGYEVRVSPFGSYAVDKLAGSARMLARAVHAEVASAAKLPPPTPGLATKPGGKSAWVFHLPQHPTNRARFPAIDFHMHCFSDWVSLEERVAILDRTNVRYGVSLVGDVFLDASIEPALDMFRGPGGDRFIFFGGFDYRRLDDPDWPEYVRRKLDEDIGLGARGVKLYKRTGGLGLLDRRGSLVMPDDERLKPIWEATAERGVPVLFHIADPTHAWEPTEENPAAYERLIHGPHKWWWGAPGFPTHETLMERMERLVADNPQTTFVFAHLASMSHDLRRCGRLLETYPNVYVDTSARLQAIGKQPNTAREFFIAHQDRILWGTDLMWPDRGGEYGMWFRVFETLDEDISSVNFGRPSPWPLYGMGLPDEVLKKVYYDNAARLLRLEE